LNEANGPSDTRTCSPISKEVVTLVGQVHLHQHIAGKELALGVDLAAAPDLGDLFLGHQDLLE
jgi:hypothetical protein